MGYKLETTALISKENYNTFRIRRIMLILEKVNAYKSSRRFLESCLKVVNSSSLIRIEQRI
ncbi:hypothetical protein FJU71_18195 [Acinetobacter baumannii]|nr:hypothetical protein FJU71_18195 [Acinetobacter baumannii]